ncbi:MAG TPA: hypothetical protein PKW55_04890 [Spirochaetota bacterium]|nr:hypothetical protein [Spirochaetota bacterium]HOM37712.1 hypothetical protein [Spirochaetota bacterium]HPQ49670.1 hypothetical protein [Spirochaetota bacterium]
MKLRKIIKYLEIIDRQLEILYINFAKCFDEPVIHNFWISRSLEKSSIFEALSLVEQVGNNDFITNEYKEEEFICVMEKLIRYIRSSLKKEFKLDRCLEIAVEIETEHYSKMINRLYEYVDTEFKQVIKELDNNKKHLKTLRNFIINHYSNQEKKNHLINILEETIKK